MMSYQASLSFSLFSKINHVLLESDCDEILKKIIHDYNGYASNKGENGSDIMIKVNKIQSGYRILTTWEEIKIKKNRKGLLITQSRNIGEKIKREYFERRDQDKAINLSVINETLQEVKSIVESTIMRSLIYINSSYIGFHAAAVQYRKRCLLFVGPSTSGKTTISLEFCHRGAKIITDDVAFINLNCCQITPFYRRVGIRNKKYLNKYKSMFEKYYPLLIYNQKIKEEAILMKDVYADEDSYKITDIVFLGDKNKALCEPGISSIMSILNLMKFSFVYPWNKESLIIEMINCFREINWWQCILGTAEETANAIIDKVFCFNVIKSNVH